MTAKEFPPKSARSILKPESHRRGSRTSKRVFFDEVSIQEYPIILGDNPAVSSGAPISIGWKSYNPQTLDVDFFECYRNSERRSRKKLILSVRRRAQCLLMSGYSLEEIANATLAAEHAKTMRAESLKGAGWADPWAMISGVAETTGLALRRADVLGVGAVVGAGVHGVNTVVGAGADVTVRTGKLLVGGAIKSTRVVTGAGNNLVVKPVGKVVSSTGRVVTNGVTHTGRAIGAGLSQTGRAMGSVVSSTGRALSMIVPGTQSLESGKLSPKRESSPMPEQLTPATDPYTPLPELSSMSIQ